MGARCKLRGDDQLTNMAARMIQIINNLSLGALRKRKDDYLVLKPIIEQSTADIAKVGAWPMNVGKFSIFIVDGSDVFTKSDPDFNTAMADERQVYKESNLRIEIGVELMKSTLFNHLLDDKTSAVQAMTHVLAHEIFHLEQGWRQRCCNFSFPLIASSFAHGVRQEMSSEWKAAIQQLATDYKNYLKESTNPKDFIFDNFTARASDTVSECCADLLGLKIFHAIHGLQATQTLASKLVAYRKLNEPISPLAYQSGQSLENFLTKHSGFDHPLELIAQETWDMAFNSLLQSPSLKESSRAAILAAPPLVFTNPLPDVFRGIAIRRSI